MSENKLDYTGGCVKLNLGVLDNEDGNWIEAFLNCE
jgi:hypothetical protein